MDFLLIYLYGFLAIIILMTFLWILSVFLENASIVDPFWSIAFIVAGITYYFNTNGNLDRKTLVITLLLVWGLRLAIYLGWRNWGKSEDFRYKQFRENYGAKRYWWFSFFQVFLLQGVLAWFISAPILAAMYFGKNLPLGLLDYIACSIWLIGFIFEAGGDFQLAKFKAKKENKGKLLTTGLWKFTRHPNYFGDATIWLSFALFSISVQSYIPILSFILMTYLIVKVSGVSLLERTLIHKKPNYKEYIQKTNSFFPWFPKK
jgi:steroid 5-alpha reductase family enzyme